MTMYKALSIHCMTRRDGYPGGGGGGTQVQQGDLKVTLVTRHFVLKKG